MMKKKIPKPMAPPEGKAPALPGTPQPAAQPQSIKLHGISQPLMGRVLKALRSCPYDDVNDLIPELVQAPLFDWSPGQR